MMPPVCAKPSPSLTVRTGSFLMPPRRGRVADLGVCDEQQMAGPPCGAVPRPQDTERMVVMRCLPLVAMSASAIRSSPTTQTMIGGIGRQRRPRDEPGKVQAAQPSRPRPVRRRRRCRPQSRRRGERRDERDARDDELCAPKMPREHYREVQRSRRLALRGTWSPAPACRRRRTRRAPRRTGSDTIATTDRRLVNRHSALTSAPV